MITQNKYRFELDMSSKKVLCPSCQQKRLVLYRDKVTGEYLPEHIGRCDREEQCGYHFTPKNYFYNSGQYKNPKPFIEVEPLEVLPVDFLPLEYLHQCVSSKFHPKNNFYLFLVSKYGKQAAINIFREYVIGTSSHWQGAAMFPQFDEKGRLHQVKIMLHNATTGKRVKRGEIVQRFDRNNNTYITETTEKSCSLVYGKYLDEHTNKLNLEQCFFGQHLLAEYDKPVCITESEKTAMIASIHLPQFIWLATGGASGCKWREYAIYKALSGRSVTFFPDHGYYNRKTEKTCFQEWKERCDRINEALPRTKVRVSDFLERRLSDHARLDQDLADLLITEHENF